MVDLDELQALADAATPGPWTVTGDDLIDGVGKARGPNGRIFEDMDVRPNDAAFIAAARAAVPELVAEVRALRAEISEARHGVWERQHEIEILTAERDANAGDLDALRAENAKVERGCERWCLWQDVAHDTLRSFGVDLTAFNDAVTERFYALGVGDPRCEHRAEVEALRASKADVSRTLYLARLQALNLWEQRNAVLALHKPVGGSVGQTCGICDTINWPCPTVAALSAADNASSGSTGAAEAEALQDEEAR